MTRFQAPNVPFVEARHMGGKQRPTLITIRVADCTSEKGAALAIANYWHTSYSPEDVSCHYVVDESVAYRCVPDKIEEGRGTKGSISILMCAKPATSPLVWDGESYSHVLLRTADLVSKLCLAYKIPNRILDEEQLAHWAKHRWRRRGGILVDVPGGWPVGRFRQLVQNSIQEVK